MNTTVLVTLLVIIGYLLVGSLLVWGGARYAEYKGKDALMTAMAIAMWPVLILAALFVVVYGLIIYSQEQRRTQ